MNGSNNKLPDGGKTDTEQDMVDRGVQHHKVGQLGAAEAAYRRVLQTQPEHATALHMLGVLEYQAGRHQEAIALITRAETHAPHDAGIHTNLGNALQACGRLEEAAADHGFSVMTMRTENLRKQKEQWIPGDLVVLKCC